MSRMQRQQWSESEKVSCTCTCTVPPSLHEQAPHSVDDGAVKADSYHSLQIALLVEISRDAQVDPVLSLARGLPVNVPEPRWEEIPLPAGTPRCIYALFTRFPFPVEGLSWPHSHDLQALTDSYEKGRSLRSCKDEYDEIRSAFNQGRPIQPLLASYPPGYQPVHSAPSTSIKRSFQEAEGLFPAALPLPNLQPRPSFSSASPVVQPANVDLTAPRPSPLGALNKPKGKPGRPSREEIARRQAEAAAAGRVYEPQVRKRKPKKQKALAASPVPPSAGASASTEVSSSSLQTPTRQPVEPQQSSSSGRRKRQRIEDPQPGPDTAGGIEPTAAESSAAGGSGPMTVAQSPSDRVRPDAKFAPRSTSAASTSRPGDGSEIVDSEVKANDPSSRTSHASFHD